MKIRCPKCGSVCYTKSSVCPVCGETHVEMLTCKVCGEDMDQDGDICSFCEEEIKGHIHYILQRITESSFVTEKGAREIVKKILNSDTDLS